MQNNDSFQALYELAKAEKYLSKHKVLDALSSKARDAFTAAIDKAKKEKKPKPKKEAGDGLDKN